MPSIKTYSIPTNNHDEPLEVGLAEPTMRMLESMPSDPKTKDLAAMLRKSIKVINGKAVSAASLEGDALTDIFGTRGFLFLVRCFNSFFEIEDDEYKKVLDSGKVTAGA